MSGVYTLETGCAKNCMSLARNAFLGEGNSRAGDPVCQVYVLVILFLSIVHVTLTAPNI